MIDFADWEPEVVAVGLQLCLPWHCMTSLACGPGRKRLPNKHMVIFSWKCFCLKFQTCTASRSGKEISTWFCVSFWMILVFPSLMVPPKHPKMISFSRKTHHEALIPIYTPENLRREPKTHLIEKETHLPSTSILGFHVNFSRVYHFSFIFHHLLGFLYASLHELLVSPPSPIIFLNKTSPILS